MASPLAMPSPKTFNDLESELCKDEVFVRLIHWWEARNFSKGNILMGVELLLIDAKSTTMQAFISANRLYRFKDALKPNTVYKLTKFIVRPSKTVYRVSPHKYGITFTEQTTFVKETEGHHEIDVQKFRLSNFQVFADMADKRTDLFDIIGHIRVINGDNIDSPTPMATAPTAAGERSKDMVGETARVYLWDKIAEAFRIRWNESNQKPFVILATTLYSKTLGGTVALSSTASTRLFFDSDVAETQNYLIRFGSDADTLPAVNSSSSSVTKLETVTLEEILKFLQNETPQIASFICIATITDVLGDHGWYFISCTGCKWKMERMETSLVCTNPECKKPENVGILRYRFEARVCDDNGGAATFVIFEEDAVKLLGRKAPDLMTEMRKNGEDAVVAMPQCFQDIVGRTCKFQVKVKAFNFRATRQTITVSRIIQDDLIKGTTLPDGTNGQKNTVNIAGENEELDDDLPESSNNIKKDGKRPRCN